jgi:hypothetical protein
LPASSASDLWDVIALEAERESPLWGQTLLPAERRELQLVFSTLCEQRYAIGLETIYEGYLLHYGRPRLFATVDRDNALLLGDYLYAHGLVRIAALNDVVAVADLSELISLCAQMRAEGLDGDSAAWVATAARLGKGGLEAGREALRLRSDPDLLLDLAQEAAGADAVERCLAVHRGRVR